MKLHFLKIFANLQAMYWSEPNAICNQICICKCSIAIQWC